MPSRSPSRPVLLLALLAVSALLPAQARTPGWLGVFAGPETAPTIAEVVPGSPAERAGLETGDRILRVGRDETPTLERLLELLDPLEAGVRVKLRVARDGVEREVDVELARRPADGTPRPDAGEPQGGRRAGRDPAPAVEVDLDAPFLGCSLSFDPGGGASVSWVLPGGPAQAAGLRAGDHVTGLPAWVPNPVQAETAAVPAPDAAGEPLLRVLRKGRAEPFSARLPRTPRRSCLVEVLAEARRAADSKPRWLPAGYGLDGERIRTRFLEQSVRWNLPVLLIRRRIDAAGVDGKESTLIALPPRLKGARAVLLEGFQRGFCSADAGLFPEGALELDTWLVVLTGNGRFERLAAGATDAELDAFLLRHAWRDVVDPFGAAARTEGRDR